MPDYTSMSDIQAKPEADLPKPAQVRVAAKLLKRDLSPQTRLEASELRCFSTNIGQLLTLRSSTANAGPRRGSDLKELGIIEDGAVLSLGGKIVSVGTVKRRSARFMAEEASQGSASRSIARAKSSFPDSWIRIRILSSRARGLWISRSASKVLPTKRLPPREAGSARAWRVFARQAKSELAAKVVRTLKEMAAYGTTTVEAKSGYGLTLDSELKSLEAIGEAASRWPGTVVATLLGAHVVPKEFQGCSQKYVEIVCKEMIPQAAKRKLAQFVDVFCDKGAFTPQETEQIFEAAKQHGLSVRAHMGQLSETKLSPFLRFNPASFDHMDHVNDDDILQLAQARYGGNACAGSELFPGIERVSERAAVDRRWRAGGPRIGLQPRDFPHDEHAYGDVAGLYAYENVTGGSGGGGHDQRGVGPARCGTQRQHRTGKRCRFRSV